MLHFVYRIRDKRTSVIGYVGITINPNARMREHLEGRDSNGCKNAWLKQADSEMEIIEVINDRKQGYIRERYWIQKHLADGEPLTNILHTKPAKPIRQKAVKIAPIVKAKPTKSIMKGKTSSRQWEKPKSGTPKKLDTLPKRVKSEQSTYDPTQDPIWQCAVKKVMAERAHIARILSQ